MIKLLYLLLILFIQVSCAEGDIFGPKKPPIPGKRLNVLHYDLMQEKTSDNKQINIPEQENLLSWNFSDIGQFTGIPYNIALPNELSLKNKFTINNFNKSAGSSLLIINDIIYTYSANILSAYDSKSRKTIWSIYAIKGKEKNDIISGSMSSNNGVIYLASGTRDLIAIDASNGKELWRFTSPNIVRYISLIYNDKIYFSSADNTITCLDLNGNLIWRYDAAIYSLVSNRIYIPNIIYQDKIVNITSAGDLIVLNRYDGSEITQVNLANSSIIGDGSLEKGPLASPVLDKDYLYILNGEHEFIKIDLANPRIVWQQNIPNSKSFWVVDNITYMITLGDNQLLAINNTDGKIIWVEELNKDPKNKNIEFYGPVLAGDKIVVTSRNGDIIMYSPVNGKELARYKNSSSTHQMPIIVNNKLYFIGYKGNISVWQ